MASRKSRKTLTRRTKEGFVSGDFKDPGTPDYVVVELRYESPVAPGARGFVSPAAAAPQAASLNDVLSHFKIRSMGSHFGLTKTEVSTRVELASSLPSAPSAKLLARRGATAEFYQSGFMQIIPKNGADARRLAKALNEHDSVWQAYVAPRPVPAGLVGSATGSRLFEPAQGYLHSAPNGIGAMEAWKFTGAKGAKITICDVEGAWNRTHEDLPKGIPLFGGTVLNDLEWRDHGTAVLGEMVSKPDSRGTVGIAHQASAAVQSAFVGEVFNPAAAITNAASKLKAGDVILIELQATGPNGKYVAMQYWDAIYSAIVGATAKGITVVEAAGNGDENFDLPVFAGTGLQKNSGAIVVGAGVPPTNHIDFDGFGAGLPAYASLGVPRSRIFFSNYGKILDLQAWGWHVTTLGYGDAQGDASENRWYTHRFSGTSSASPIVAGSVASIQGRAIAKNGAPLLPAKVKSLLISSGTPQAPGPGVPLTQHIGPQPNLARAVASI